MKHNGIEWKKMEWILHLIVWIFYYRLKQVSHLIICKSEWNKLFLHTSLKQSSKQNNTLSSNLNKGANTFKKKSCQNKNTIKFFFVCVCFSHFYSCRIPKSNCLLY